MTLKIGQTVQAYPNNQTGTYLLGSWVLEGSTHAGQPAGLGTRVKTFTEDGWAVTQIDPLTQSVMFHHGSGYRLDGTRYAETIENANAITSSLVGQTLTYEVVIEGDVMRQVGPTWQERWTRSSLSTTPPALRTGS